MTLRRQAFIRAKKTGKRWTMLTAYDAPTAELLEACGIDLILVGDSLGMVLLGYESTIDVTMDEMIHHAKAVRRGAQDTPLIGDLPLKGLEKSPKQALVSAERFMNEAGCDGVKLEWGKKTPETLALLVRHKIPVMGHVGLTPQSLKRKEKFKLQGKDAESAYDIFKKAKYFEDHGAFSVLLECVPAALSKRITGSLKIPTIGIGAGPECDGQVLVFYDLVGLFTKFKPRFVKRYAEVRETMQEAVKNYVREVETRRFPDANHSFTMPVEEIKLLDGLLGKRSDSRS